jgi:hypothetical protein
MKKAAFEAAKVKNLNIFKWLPFLNTYRTMCLSPDVAFLEVIEQVGALRIAA